MFLAQTAVDAGNVGSALVNASSSFGPEVWLASLVLVFCAVGVGFYLWKIAIPNAQVSREVLTKLSTVCDGLTATTKDTNEVAKSVDVEISHVKRTLNQVVQCKVAETIALERVAEHLQIDLASQVGEIRGILKASQSHG